jgi:putative ABC transport system permease protein
MARQTLSSRLYRWFLRLFPSEFRGDFGDDMSRVFADERADASERGHLAVAGLWLRTLRGFASIAPREHLHVLMRDAGYAARLMWKHRLTTAAIILTLALGVGASTAMFTVVKTVILELPFRDPDRLVVVHRQTSRSYTAGIALSQFGLWKNQTGAFESIAASWGWSPVLTGAGEIRRLGLECVSPNMFVTLGASPAVGRTFTEAEGIGGDPSLIVISHAMWTRTFGRDPDAIGRSIALDGAPSTIIGVMPDAFDGTRAVRQRDGWITLADCVRRSRREGRQIPFVNLYARLAPGASAKTAEAQLESTLEAPRTPDDRPGVRLVPLTEQILGEVRDPLLALQGAAAFVLLIGCANIASLLLGRAEGRRRELAVRVALGCTRSRLIRQLLTESAITALCGGAAGLLVAYWSLQGLVSLIPGSVPRVERIAIDRGVLLACLAMSLTTGLLFGLLPAWTASRVSPGFTLKDTMPGTGPARRKTRGVLIVAEIALSLAVLAGAGLLVRTFLHLRPVDPGFDPAGKLAMTINLPRSRYVDGQAWAAFFNAVRPRLLGIPGVRAVEMATYLPMSGFVSQGEIELDPGTPTRTVDMPAVTSNYLAEMRIGIVRGRTLSEQDRMGATDVAIVNDTMARRFWPGQDPLGQQVRVRTLDGWSTRTIVGIARDTRNMGSRLTSNAEMFVPFAQSPASIQRFVLMTAQPAEVIGPLVKAQVAAVDPALPVGDVQRVDDITTIRAVATWRFASLLMGAFAIMALVLAAIGLFALVVYWVTERTSEIGVRIALGAGRDRVLRMFLARGARLVACGLVCGLALAALTTRFLAEWLVHITPLDRASFAGAAAIMAVVCLLATWLAARRATQIDPLAALRGE